MNTTKIRNLNVYPQYKGNEPFSQTLCSNPYIIETELIVQRPNS